MRKIVPYIFILAVGGIAIWSTFFVGRKINAPIRSDVVYKTAPYVDAHALTRPDESPRGPLGVLLTQIIVVVLTARILGSAASKLGQPEVVGEIAAGVLLGPSFLGFISPAAMCFLFPASSLATLNMFSQIGVILFMFVVGTQFDIRQLSERAHATVVVSHASIILPFLLGTILSLFIYHATAPPGVSFTAFALFIGIAMSVTAFPVLARIVDERGLTHSELGIVSLGCAAVDDVTAWCILAVVVAIAKADGLRASFLTLLLVIVYASFMIFVLKRLLERLFHARPHSVSATNVNGNCWTAIVAFALAASLATEVIGVHALFGAFLAGVILPNGELRSSIKDRFQGLIAGLLLPLFFAFTGLRTQFTALDSPFLWLICAVIIIAAIAGKVGGSTLAARWSGMRWSDALGLGFLMNTRGLMELIVLNIGYDLGILSTEMFTIFVAMAFVTTVITSPLLNLTHRAVLTSRKAACNSASALAPVRR